MTEVASIFRNPCSLGAPALLPLDECISQLGGLSCLVQMSTLPNPDPIAVLANAAVSRVVYDIQLEVILSLAKHAGGVPGQGIAVMERLRETFLRFSKVDPLATRWVQAYELIGSALATNGLDA